MIDEAEVRRQRAGEAQRLLDEPLLNEVLDKLHQLTLDDLLAVDADLEAEVKNTVLVERLRAVRWIRDGLKAIVNAHESAKRQKFGVV